MSSIKSRALLRRCWAHHFQRVESAHFPSQRPGQFERKMRERRLSRPLVIEKPAERDTRLAVLFISPAGPFLKGKAHASRLIALRSRHTRGRAGRGARSRQGGPPALQG